MVSHFSSTQVAFSQNDVVCPVTQSCGNSNWLSSGAVKRPKNVPYKDVQVQTADKIILRGVLIEHTQPRGTVIMFHPNGANHSFLLGHAKHYYRFSLNVLMVSYRGFGGSKGVPSEKGMCYILPCVFTIKYLLVQLQVSRRTHKPFWIMLFTIPSFLNYLLFVHSLLSGFHTSQPNHTDHLWSLAWWRSCYRCNE